jgi:hypothetical protein
MMDLPENPALKAFVQQINLEFVLAQVLLRRQTPGFELRHLDDRARPEDDLRLVEPGAVRELAQFTAGGAFRPLKSAPNLRAGWRVNAPDEAALADVLNMLYPGAVADLFAAESPDPPVTSYREFVGRQTGMYRIAAKLDDLQAGRMIRSGCDARFCLKRRLWSVEGLAPDAPEAKSAIPCLEPCAVLLEFARITMRLEQAEKVGVPIGAEEAETLIAALENALDHPNPAVREGDVSSPLNPRRTHLALQKIREALRLVSIPDQP